MLLKGSPCSTTCSSSCTTAKQQRVLSHKLRSPAATPTLPQQRFIRGARQQHICRAEISPQSGETESTNNAARRASTTQTTTQSPAEEAQARSEAQTIGELKRQQLQSQSQTNVLQGALEEAQLITWPSVKKAFADTILVIAIVAATGSLLFGVNVLLAEGSQWWYHR
uniref:Preprotein translocase subunit SecE n=1 Tax=Dunaliella tertiolecta TaxID=3047 RepID=A0A7S3VHX9_DUNTE|mmetsp:Transcript_6352/g.16926  ORF Transcript_6352/g.16926 Transcript_6352/m.16926 type:complete len:168 (-) Transcript_6352:522-1025(-)|eukprot:CAMPEP_0202388850 /NCGR_PEP_ID=MMETSP1127-20130417/79810_1 /ASSEMBLY_ACC=CAM_ASM_000462 /TAXON_ID=3047 /ORGANISM="Dunaliella tertiolecta, Strain CCMP1320" /LENGTH=167 /DNA_ID=CAMNT_0048990415 /DNA_START=129 /DNA_END=632 /DNA_ORIENTATION=-